MNQQAINYNNYINDEIQNSNDKYRISYPYSSGRGGDFYNGRYRSGWRRGRGRGYTCSIRVPGDYGYHNNYAGLYCNEWNEWCKSSSDAIESFNNQLVLKIISRVLPENNDDDEPIIRRINKKNIILPKIARSNNNKTISKD